MRTVVRMVDFTMFSVITSGQSTQSVCETSSLVNFSKTFLPYIKFQLIIAVFMLGGLKLPILFSGIFNKHIFHKPVSDRIYKNEKIRVIIGIHISKKVSLIRKFLSLKYFHSRSKGLISHSFSSSLMTLNFA